MPIKAENIPTGLCLPPELDPSELITADLIAGEWTRLAVWSNAPDGSRQGEVERNISRTTALVDAKDWSRLFPALGPIGNTVNGLGSSLKEVASGQYRYRPFFEFRISAGGAEVLLEPLVFPDRRNNDQFFFINPDIILFFGLTDRDRTNREWWDPGVMTQVIRRARLNAAYGELNIVEVRAKYLRRYLKARQCGLLIAHYEDVRLVEPSSGELEVFREGLIALGSNDGERVTTHMGSEAENARVRLESFSLDSYVRGKARDLMRRVHLWSFTPPEPIDTQNPWRKQAPFDLGSFLLPTRKGDVAPGRWKCHHKDDITFEGAECHFMDSVYFRQEVLMKYEGMPNCTIADNGNLHCRSYLVLNRSTRRIGNALLATAIGDFAEGIPWEEWPHWQQHAVPPPSSDDREVIEAEVPIPEAVNSVVRALWRINDAVMLWGSAHGIEACHVWSGSLDSPAGRHLKRIYPDNAGEDHFLERATYLSTLAIEGLNTQALRSAVNLFGSHMHRADPLKKKKSNPLGSRKLLERWLLLSRITVDISPNEGDLPTLVSAAEQQSCPRDFETDLWCELRSLWQGAYDDLAPLAFLYDVRNAAGIAHAPSRERASKAIELLGLPTAGWGRRHYLELLCLLQEAVEIAAVSASDAARYCLYHREDDED